MATIKFANGEVHECAGVAPFPPDNTIFVALKGVNAVQAAVIFSDVEKVSVMEFGNRRYVGYTELRSIGIREDYIEAALKGGHDEIRY